MSWLPADREITVEPFWDVQAVSDPDGEGSDFAYTVGLADLDLSGLHL
jgi:hypothetical protein